MRAFINFGIFFIIFISYIRGQALERPPQFVLISFDGSYTNTMWEATREGALKNGAKVTHFISGVDFLIGSSTRSVPGATYRIYTPPRWNGGRRSDIGFGGTRTMLEERIRQIQKSFEAGMEIAGHANAHFDGSTWTEAEWTYEFNWFHRLVLEVFSINSLDEKVVKVSQAEWQKQMLTQMKSFRAPYLGRGRGLWNTLGRSKWEMLGQTKNHSYTYDASDVSRNTAAWPEKSPQGFWYFRMATIPVTELGRNVLSMDYNFYVAHSDNPNSPKDKPERAKDFEEQMYRAYVKWFIQNYHGNRAPINIGHHFSTWNRGAYWKALQRFMKDVCQLPEVSCTQGQELVSFMEGLSPSHYRGLRLGQFNRQGLPRVDIEHSIRPTTQKFQTEPLLKSYPFQTLNKAILPIAENMKFYWYLRFQDLKIESRTLDLIKFSQMGVTRVDIVGINLFTKKTHVTSWKISWDPILNHATLEPEWDDLLTEPACTVEAHREVVNPRYLHDATDI